ncbi:MAG: DUF4065 domain-containing protein [Galactobacillus timonensis]|uniref:Panacea domain-containing protein n=1 Tax=Galactobacillus timonensis TaxID=2041840 RepID=UPI002409396C|nr:type II toxin-antitoxin system antitoxin SocA domain-containing protein [Galactobacillus timonensis]MDD5851187.1 DUF4065 domain-containing protein [Galactobacillus timonensis]MDD6600783.1 DUF4065 domain-containing protein [Galactobacillus timonensis]
MATVFDVAKYILEKKGTMTTMKLQKLCYYSQAWSLVWDDQPLFDEDFEAWANGPVCNELYNEHRGMYTISSDELKKGDPSIFDSTQKATIDAVLDYYGDKEPHWLSQLTHLEDPWKNARGNCKPGERCNTVIPKQSMQEYYRKLDS